MADQADCEGEGRDEEVDEGQQHEAHQLQVGPQHHRPVGLHFGRVVNIPTLLQSDPSKSVKTTC